MLGIRFVGGLSKAGEEVYLTLSPVTADGGQSPTTWTFKVDDAALMEFDADTGGLEVCPGEFVLVPAFRRPDGDSTLAPGANQAGPAGGPVAK